MKMLRRLAYWTEFDTRSLAAFRIFMGLCLCYDLLLKLIYAKDFYSDWGLMPRAYWVTQYMNKSKISLMLANGEPWFQYAFVFVALLCAVCFTIGYRTRLFQVLSLILLGSIQSRNFLILSCADDLLRLALFWSVLLPLDYHYSLKGTTPATSNSFAIRSVGGGLFLLQLMIMYIITAFYKLNPVWTEEYSAIYYALNIDHFTTHFGHWLAQFAELGQLLTRMTLAWEFVGPLLLLSPLFSKQVRAFVALGFIGFHFGLFLCLNLGTFPWVAMAYWCAFLPGEIWEKIFSLPKKLNLKALTFQKVQACDIRKMRFTEGVFVILMAIVLLQNIADLTENRKILPAPLRKTLLALNLNQVWDMFAPYPIRNDGWFILEGNFKNGETRELLTGNAITEQKPEYISNLYASSEWRKFYLNMWDDGKERILLPFSRYMCRSQVASDGSSPLMRLKITFMKERTPLLGETFPPVEPVILWNHDCFAP